MGVVVFLGRVELAHWAESKWRHRLGGLPKSFHHQLAMWINDVTPFPKGSGPAVNDVETVYREHNLKAQVGSVPNHDGITAPFLSDNEPAVTNKPGSIRPLSSRSSIVTKTAAGSDKIGAGAPKLPCLPLHEFLPCHCNKRRRRQMDD